MDLKRVGLTGASGMLGRHIVAQLADGGVESVSCSRSKPNKLPEHSSWQALDLAKNEIDVQLDEIFLGCNAIIHTAALLPGDSDDRAQVFSVNVNGALQVAHWAHRHSLPCVFISSAAVYDDPHASSIRESDPRGSGNFGGYVAETKYLAEQQLNKLAGQGLELTILRPSALYGFGARPNNLISRMVAQASAGETIELEEPSTDQINFVHASDVARVAIKALENNVRGVFNVGYPQLYTIREVAEICVSVVGSGRMRSSGSRYDREPFQRFDLCLDALSSEIGYAPSVDLRSGITKVVEGRLL